MPKRFDGCDRVAAVAGADSGIGEAIALALAHEGYEVGVTRHCDEAGAQRTAEKVRAAGRRCGVRQLDLTRLPDVATAAPDAAVAATLASPAERYVTGVSYLVAAGMRLMGPQAGSRLQSDDWRHG